MVDFKDAAARNTFVVGGDGSAGVVDELPSAPGREDMDALALLVEDQPPPTGVVDGVNAASAIRGGGGWVEIEGFGGSEGWGAVVKIGIPESAFNGFPGDPREPVVFTVRGEGGGV